jgi:hypothetical protein
MDLIQKWERTPLTAVGSRKFDQVIQSSVVSDPSGGPGPRSGFQSIIEELFVRKVSVFAEDGQNGKPRFSISLELDRGSDPSNHIRRTERVQCLTLEVEEKELPTFARLSGRSLEISLTKELSQISSEEFQEEILVLREEVRKLHSRKNYLEEQLQFAFEQLRETSS